MSHCRQSFFRPRRHLVSDAGPSPHLPLAGERITILGAWALFDLARSHPPQAETFVLSLDEEHRGNTVVAIDGATDAAQVRTVIDMFCEINVRVDHKALLMATVRPVGAPLVCDHDVRAWPEFRRQCAALDIELIDWVLIGGDYSVWMAEFTSSPSLWR